MIPEFKSFEKMPRLSREVVITEKIDGTNAQVFITEEGEVFAGSRNKWIQPEGSVINPETGKVVKGTDNYGFAQWVRDNAEELRKLGPGRHFGEWWGQGIQRGYGLQEKRFSLFNTDREVVPSCCHLVPVLYRGNFSTFKAEEALINLQHYGSIAAPGFSNPEGIIIYHTAARMAFKKTIEGDESPKSLLKAVE